jgi:hypothetical protein
VVQLSAEPTRLVGALAASIIPAAAVRWFVPSDDYHVEPVSGPLDAALFGGLFVLPLAVAIAIGWASGAW